MHYQSRVPIDILGFNSIGMSNTQHKGSVVYLDHAKHLLVYFTIVLEIATVKYVLL